MAVQKKIEGEEVKHYKSPILYLHKSKAGGHLYAFNVEKEGGEGTILGGEIESLIMNVSDVQAIVEGRMEWAKVSVVLKGGAE